MVNFLCGLMSAPIAKQTAMPLAEYQYHLIILLISEMSKVKVVLGEQVWFHDRIITWCLKSQDYKARIHIVDNLNLVLIISLLCMIDISSFVAGKRDMRYIRSFLLQNQARNMILGRRTKLCQQTHTSALQKFQIGYRSIQKLPNGTWPQLIAHNIPKTRVWNICCWYSKS